MNDEARRQMLRDMLSKRFGSHQCLICRYRPEYPRQAEREYQRVTDAYLDLLWDVLQKHLPKIEAAAARQETSRQDDTGDLLALIDQIFQQMGIKLDESIFRFNFRQKVERMAHLARKLTIREWKRAVHATLGIDLFDDYYLGEFFRQALAQWVDQNVDLIVTIPRSTLGKMREMVLDAYRNGETTKSLLAKIEQFYGITKRHARLIARDQIAKLNGQITRKEQQDAGVREYIWSTSGDSRVRERHRQLNGKRFSWDDPPVVDPVRGRREHPGGDYQCRCVALPIFELEGIDLPVSGEAGTPPAKKEKPKRAAKKAKQAKKTKSGKTSKQEKSGKSTKQTKTEKSAKESKTKKASEKAKTGKTAEEKKTAKKAKPKSPKKTEPSGAPPEQT